MEEMLDTIVVEDDIQEYLIFTVENIDFGIDIVLVQEIIAIQKTFPIPNAYDFCRGIINIRGTIVPVLDMRRKLGFEAVEYNDRACIIVIMLGTVLIGIIVDMVQDVIRIQKEDLIESPAHTNSERSRNSYTSKLANVDGKIRQILDVNSVFEVDLDI